MNTPMLVGDGYGQVLTSGWFVMKLDGTLLGLNGRDFSRPFDPLGNGFIYAAGNRHSVAVKSNGGIWTRGQNDYGQLGVGSMPNVFVPVLVGNGYARVAAGGSHSVAIKTDGSLWTWGDGLQGALGNGTFQVSASPVLVGTGFAKISAGDQDVFAIKTDGTLWAWGANRHGLCPSCQGQWPLLGAQTRRQPLGMGAQ